MNADRVRPPVFVVLAVLCGCAPPPPPVGYVSVSPGERGQVDVSGGAGGGGHGVGGGGGAAALHVDAYASPRTSIPVDAWGGFAGVGFGAGRVGVRHRLSAPMALGGGVSGGYPSYVGPDLELATGWEGNRVAGSFAARPGVQFLLGADLTASSFQMTTDFTLRFLGPQRRGGFDLGFFFFFGSSFDGTGLVGGGLSLGGGGRIRPRRSRGPRGDGP